MDKVLADTLVANLKSAKTPDDLAHAQTLALIAIVDCQCKTAERVKSLISIEEERRHRIDAVGWVARCVVGFAAGGGFVVLAKIAKLSGVL